MKRFCGCRLSALGLTLVACLVVFKTQASQDVTSQYQSPFKLSIYSESVYDARFDGAVTETRFRLYPKTQFLLKPYAGLVVSQDLSNGRAPMLIENMLAPTVGAQAKIFKYFYLFAENRYLFRFQNEMRSDSENELRYGAFAYNFWTLKNQWFNETYAELVTVDRVDDKPVFAAWNKIGHRYQTDFGLRADVYLEGFTRISPNLGYGPNENEFRAGLRATYVYSYWAASMIVNHAIFSDVKAGGTDALLVISREVY